MASHKTHPHIISSADAALVVVDMQDRLINAMWEPDRLRRNTRILVQGAIEMRVPIVATTQNAVKLGETSSELQDLLSPLDLPYDKMTFSCWPNPGFASALQRSGRKQVILCGAEAHVCVSQTAHDLILHGYQVHIAADAVSSRTELNWRLGLDKMRQAGALTASTELALFEMLCDADNPEFRTVHKLLK